MTTVWHDLRFAARVLVKERGFTLAAAFALALGIGANSAVFTLVNAVLLRGLPFEDPDRVMWVGTRDSRNRDFGMSVEDFEDMRRASRTFAGVSGMAFVNFNLSEESVAPEQYSGVYISGNAFAMLGQRAVLGRTLTNDDDRPGAPAVVVLGNGVWRTRYGADPGILGRTVKLNQLPAVVVGVMPEGMRFPPNSDIWMPLEHLPTGLRQRGRQVRQLQAIGRLAEGASIEQANSDLQAIGTALARDFPASNKDNSFFTMRYNDRVNGGPIRFVFLAAMGSVVFVLLIACANVANLLLARAAHRAREISVCVSLGATRWRIVRQLLVESMLLAAIGGAIGLVISLAGVRMFDAATSDPRLGKPYFIQFTMDATVFAFVAAISLGTGIVFGLAPALHVSKTNVNEVLKEGGRSGAVGVRARRWTGALIVGELALTMVLLAGAAFMMRSFLAHYRMDTGVDTTRLLLMNLSLPDRKYHTHDERIAFVERVDERLGGVGTFEAATTASSSPLLGGPVRQLTIDGRPAPAGETLPLVTMVTVGARYFETIGASIQRGRGFERSDGGPGREHAIVNERFAATYFSGEDPIGRRIRLTEETPTGPQVPPLTIVGVSRTVRQRAQPGTEADPVVYLPTRANPNAAYGTALLVRTRSNTADPASLIPAIREEIRALDPDMPVFNIRTLDEALAQQRWPMRVFGTMFAILAFIALVLSAVGLYVVTAYSVVQRTQEIGVRMALGAQAPQVWWLVFRRAAVQLGIGLAIGLAGSVAAGRLLQQLPFVRTSSYDPATLTSIASILIGVAVAACFWPARRATRLDPVIALRYD
jgi:putative ABC transport system permease protein